MTYRKDLKRSAKRLIWKPTMSFLRSLGSTDPRRIFPKALMLGACLLWLPFPFIFYTGKKMLGRY